VPPRWGSFGGDGIGYKYFAPLGLKCTIFIVNFFLRGEAAQSERDSSGTTVATERSEGAKVMERIARREPTRSGGEAARPKHCIVYRKKNAYLAPKISVLR
jgi:hypothetical protein